MGSNDNLCDKSLSGKRDIYPKLSIFFPQSVCIRARERFFVSRKCSLMSIETIAINYLLVPNDCPNLFFMVVAGVLSKTPLNPHFHFEP